MACTAGLAKYSTEWGIGVRLNMRTDCSMTLRPGRRVRPMTHRIRWRHSVSPIQTVRLPSGLCAMALCTGMKVVARWW